MNSLVLETMQIVPLAATGPRDVNGDAIAGDYVSLKYFDRCAVVISAGAGTGGSDIAVSIYQATSVAGGSAKVLNALVTGRIFSKEHASTLEAVGGWTREVQAVADEAYAPTDSGETVLLWVFELKAADLDVANGFDCIRADVSNPGAAKIVAGFYLLAAPRYADSPENMKSAIAD